MIIHNYNLMKENIQTLLHGIQWERKQNIGGVTFVPIIGKLENQSSGIEIGSEEIDSIQVTELEPEDVNHVNIQSDFDGTILIIAGMVLMGGRQTRSPTRPFIINQGTKQKTPVNCIEQGRWSYTMEDAVDPDKKKFRMMRKMVSRKTRASYSQEGMSQSRTWGNISQYMSEQNLSDVEVPTSSYLGVEEAIKTKSADELKKFRTELKPVFSQLNQRGLLIFENGELTDIEVFDNPDYWAKVSEQMMESNLIDVLKLQKEAPKEIDENISFDKIKIAKTNSVADEDSYSLEFEKKSGWAVGSNDKLVYLNLSKKIEGGMDFPAQVQFQSNTYDSMQEQAIQNLDDGELSDLE